MVYVYVDGARALDPRTQSGSGSAAVNAGLLRKRKELCLSEQVTFDAPLVFTVTVTKGGKTPSSASMPVETLNLKPETRNFKL